VAVLKVPGFSEWLKYATLWGTGITVIWLSMDCDQTPASLL
jgi:hypothetical protein